MNGAEAAILGAATITAIGAIMAAIFSARNGDKLAQTGERLAEIHILVNSNLADARHKLEMANLEIHRLNIVIQNLSQMRDVLYPSPAPDAPEANPA